MPIEFGLWRLDSGAVEAVPPAQLQDEAQLESVIEQRVDMAGLGQLLILGRQVVTDYGKKIDLLAMDGQGDLYLIELKRDRTPREVVAQALEYGWWVEPLSWDRISAIYAKHHDEADLATAFNEHFDGEIPETVNNAHHLVVVASRMDTSTEQIVEYVRRYGVPINVLFFQYLEDGERRYLARSWLRGPDEEVVSSGTSKKQPAWNGVDVFVAVGENQHRNWDDMRRFGFVSAGHGDKYRKAMSNLFEAARVWACIPGSGYVGVGEVTQAAVGVRDFYVKNEDRPTPIAPDPTSSTHQVNLGGSAQGVADGPGAGRRQSDQGSRGAGVSDEVGELVRGLSRVTRRGGCGTEVGGWRWCGRRGRGRASVKARAVLLVRLGGVFVVGGCVLLLGSRS